MVITKPYPWPLSLKEHQKENRKLDAIAYRDWPRWKCILRNFHIWVLDEIFRYKFERIENITEVYCDFCKEKINIHYCFSCYKKEALKQ